MQQSGQTSEQSKVQALVRQTNEITLQQCSMHSSQVLRAAYTSRDAQLHASGEQVNRLSECTSKKLRLTKRVASRSTSVNVDVEPGSQVPLLVGAQWLELQAGHDVRLDSLT